MNGSGTVVWQAAYLPFGKAQVTVLTVKNNLRFPGQYYDAETGVAIEGAGGIPVNYSKRVGYAADALQAYCGAQAIGLGSALIGYTSATWPPPAFALAGGLELGFAFNHFYERLNGQPLGADFYDWIHRNDNCQ